MNSKIKIKIDITNKQTNQKIKSVELEGNSLVRNFLEMIIGGITETNRTCKDLNGATYTIRFASDFNASSLFGLLGTSGAEESIEDYTLENYVKSYVTTIQNIESLPNGYRIVAVFNFEVLPPYTIREVGIYQQMFDTSGNRRDILLIRNLLTSPIEINQPSIVTLTYDITLTI